MKNYIFIKGKKQGVLIKILHDDILFIKSSGDYCEVHTNKGRHAVYFSLIILIDKLPTDIFYRCSRSYIVNVDKIKTIIHFNITMEGDAGAIIPIGVDFKDDLLKKINFISKHK
jgi:DNA-binding LytR/AlgR family response regulator